MRILIMLREKPPLREFKLGDYHLFFRSTKRGIVNSDITLLEEGVRDDVRQKCKGKRMDRWLLRSLVIDLWYMIHGDVELNAKIKDQKRYFRGSNRIRVMVMMDIIERMVKG